MISFKHTGDFKKTDDFLKRIKERQYRKILDKYAAKGVEALRSYTPKDTGLTASSWTYEIKISDGGMAIEWHNHNVNKGVNIAVILQYGHGTRRGGYVSGRDYINPALRPIFDKLADDAWKEVTKS